LAFFAALFSIAGMHGSGLYSAIAMKKPAIVEFSERPISNRNAFNLMGQIGGCYQGLEFITRSKYGTLDPRQVWPKIVSALHSCGIMPP
jgi:hypothetical protein